MKKTVVMKGLNKHILDEIADHLTYPPTGQYVYSKGSEILQLNAPDSESMLQLVNFLAEIVVHLVAPKTHFFEDSIEKIAVTINGIIYYAFQLVNEEGTWVVETQGDTYYLDGKHTVESAIWRASVNHESIIFEQEQLEKEAFKVQPLKSECNNVLSMEVFKNGN